MKLYEIRYRMEATVRFQVQAESEQEAIEKAEQGMVDADFGPAEDINWAEPETSLIK